MSVAAAPLPSGNNPVIRKQVELPWSKSIEFAMKSIKIRFWRSMITAGGIFLGIAFLASVLTSKSVAGSGIDPKEASRLTWLIILSLLVCVVGITNSMLMSVTERFREIGTMKCLGALNEFVVRLFMIEAFFLGVIASSLGCVVGTVLMLLLRAITHPKDEAVLGSYNLSAALITVAICVPVGSILTAVATYFPALQAARIPPAAALRVDV
jgi:small-conductance mechanosensitive channel